MQELDDLAERFWQWRARQQPRGRDDIPRLDRPAGWLPEVGTAAVEEHRGMRDRFAAELGAVRPVEVADRVDHRLLRSAVARLTWELDVLKVWSQPQYYVDQAIGPVFDALLRPGVDEARVGEVVRFLEAAPRTLGQARAVLASHCAAQFAALTVDELDGVDAAVEASALALAPVAGDRAESLRAAAIAAGRALVEYREWLAARLSSMPSAQPVGREHYQWFLREVACVPLDSDRIRDIGRREYDRAVVLEQLARVRGRDAGDGDLPRDAAAQCERESRDVDAVRRFYEEHDLLTQPPGLRRYLNAPLPDYLEPLRFLGVTDDLTGPQRLDEDGISYVPAPSPELAYFYAANARDPRLGIVHEGAHHQQLALSWANPRPVRRHYYDSGSNEGIAFYNEELMLAAGLFDDALRSRTILYNMMRLRALRVELDVGLAVGDLDIPTAATLLQTRVPMDRQTAVEEASFFAQCPGQALTYQIGKTQILALVADAVRLEGDAFELRRLHDSLWINGNVPIALQRWELLGLTDELEAIGVTP
jgi:hypothetical protein